MQNLRLGVPSDGRGDPAFDAYQMFVAGRQRIGGDQDRAQVLNRFAHRKFIQAGVGQGSLPGAELGQHHRSLALVQPARHGVGSLAVGQVLIQALQFAANLGAAAEQLAQP